MADMFEAMTRQPAKRQRLNWEKLFWVKKTSDRWLYTLALNIENIDLEELLALFLKFKSVIFSASLGAVQIQTM